MKNNTSLIIIDSEATNSRIAVALNQQGILLATIKYPRLPIWYKDEVVLLYQNYESISYKTLSLINTVKKIFDGCMIVEYTYTGKKEETF